MMKPTELRRLPDAELEIMQVLWDAAQPMQRAEIDAALDGARAPQAVVTLLTRLEEKGFVQREKKSRNYRYAPVIAREAYLQSESKTLREKLFGGNPADFIAALSAARALSREDIDEMEQLLQKAKEEL